MFCNHCKLDHEYWVLNEDNDPVCGYCGWIEYGEIPKIILEAVEEMIGRSRRDRQIITDWDSGEYTRGELATKYSISHSRVSEIIRNGFVPLEQKC
jgi:hypothetical protein